jgi:hypothetical protein
VSETGACNFVLIRDLYGRMRLLCPKLDKAKQKALASAWMESMGTIADANRPLWSDSDFFDVSSLRSHPQMQKLIPDDSGIEVGFLERGVIGADWLESSFGEHPLVGGRHPSA